MSLLNYVTAAFLAVLLMGSGSVMAAEEGVTAKVMSKLVVLRGKENKRTRDTSFNVFIDNRQVGRMFSQSSHEIEVPAGEYTLRSNFNRDKPITVTMEAGETYYVVAKMKARPTFKTVYEVVDQGYAYEILPELAAKTVSAL